MENRITMKDRIILELTNRSQQRGSTRRDKCPECGSQNLITDYDTGETVCGDCGFVLAEQMVAKEQEWRAYTQEEDASRSRVGRPEFYSVHDKGLSTTLEPIGRDSLGRTLRPSTFLQMKRLSKHQRHSRVHLSEERNLAQAMTELDRLSGSNKLSIPPLIKEKAAIIYRKALDKGLIRGRTIVGMAVATLYAACRESGVQRTLREIAKVSFEMSGVDKKEVARCYRLLLKETGLKMPIVDPISYVPKIASQTKISEKTQGLAVKILLQAKKKKILPGRDRMSLAAAALYIACLENNEKKTGLFGSIGPITQKDIAEAAGVTEVTVRNRYKEMERKLDLKLPKKGEIL